MELLRCTASLPWGSGQWNSCNALPHYPGAVGSLTPAMHCLGVVWCGVVWCGVVWCGVVWCGVVWCGVVWCGVVWCGVVRCAATCLPPPGWGPDTTSLTGASGTHPITFPCVELGWCTSQSNIFAKTNAEICKFNFLHYSVLCCEVLC